MSRTRVLVTGMSGLIGGAVRRQLQGKYELRALNRRPLPGIDCHQGDISRLESIQDAFRDVDTVVHLAAVATSQAPWDEILAHNVIGTYNVFEAARRAGVRRVVFASSGAIVSGVERVAPYAALVAGRYDEAPSWPMLTHESPARPMSLYGCSKVWGESLARLYADVHGLSMLCVRIGSVNDADRPTSSREFSVWCSQRDVAQIIQRCIAAPDSLRFDVFFAVSDNRWSYRDIDHPRAVLGFVPEDRAEDHR